MAWRKGLGRIRLCDDSLKRAGLKKGTVVLIKLGAEPKDGDLCAAFLPVGGLRVRRYDGKDLDGNITLDKGEGSKVIQVFAPGALFTFGPVVGVGKGGAS